jgi:hypothetical protein
MYEDDDEDDYYDMFIYPVDLDPGLTEMLKKSMRTLDYRLFVYNPGARRSRAVLENAMETLSDCEFMIIILTPRNVDSALLNQFAGIASSMEQRMGVFCLPGARGKGILSLADRIEVGGDNEEIVSSVLRWLINEEGIEVFGFKCSSCRDDDEYELPTPRDIENWEHNRQPFEVIACCEHINRFNPKTLLPL